MIFALSTLTLSSALVFLIALCMNLVRKNTTLISLYLIQSLITAFALLTLSISEGATGLLYAALLTLAVKAIMAPLFLFQLIRKYSAHFSAASYMSTPLTLILLTIVTGFAYVVSARLAEAGASPSVPLLLAAIFSAFFLMVNRRGALSAVIGILALESAVVLLSATLGAAHTLALEFTIAFDIAVWIAIAAAFLRMLHREFGMADADQRMISHLTEE